MKDAMKTLPGLGCLSTKLIWLISVIFANLTACLMVKALQYSIFHFVSQKASKDSESVKAFSEKKLVVSTYQVYCTTLPHTACMSAGHSVAPPAVTSREWRLAPAAACRLDPGQHLVVYTPSTQPPVDIYYIYSVSIYYTVGYHYILFVSGSCMYCQYTYWNMQMQVSAIIGP